MSRLSARRAAMQMIYEDMLGGEGGDDTLLGLIEFKPDDERDDDYIKALTEGVKQYQADIDQEIASRSQTRELTRIPVLVRSILRLAMYEMNYLKDTPSSVIINEAVELAKLFGEEGDSRFINGLLGSYLRDTQPT